MYRSLRRIYDTLYNVLDTEFGPETDDSELQTFNRGFFFQKGQNPVNEYPLAFLEWGRVSDVEVNRAPEEYSYIVVYRLFYFIQTGGKECDLANQVFRFDPTDTSSPPGVGEFAEKVCNFFFSMHHTSRFSEAWEYPDNMDSETEWSILDLTVDASIITFSTVTDATLLSIRQFLEGNPDFRGIQINFSFRVREREEIF